MGWSVAELDAAAAADSVEDAPELAFVFKVEFECQDVKSVFFIDDLKAAASRARADILARVVVVTSEPTQATATASTAAQCCEPVTRV